MSDLQQQRAPGTERRSGVIHVYGGVKGISRVCVIVSGLFQEECSLVHGKQADVKTIQAPVRTLLARWLPYARGVCVLSSQMPAVEGRSRTHPRQDTTRITRYVRVAVDQHVQV